MTKKATILMGVSASGKSYHAKKFLLEDDNAVYINRDYYRKLILGLDDNTNLWDHYNFDKKIETQVTKDCDFLLEKAIKADLNLVIDNTHLNVPQRELLLSKLNDNGYEVCVHNTTTFEDLNYYFKNNFNRVDKLPRGVINDQFIRQCVNKDVHESIFQTSKIALVDIDGTVALNDGHRHYFDYSKVSNDKPIQHVIDVVQALYDTGKVDYIQFLSGRESVCYDDTYKWLSFHGFDMSTHRLLMRLRRDKRKDSIVKKEIYDNCLINKEVKYVFDDRNQMVDLWTDMGLPVFNVGDYRETF